MHPGPGRTWKATSRRCAATAPGWLRTGRPPTGHFPPGLPVPHPRGEGAVEVGTAAGRDVGLRRLSGDRAARRTVELRRRRRVRRGAPAGNRALPRCVPSPSPVKGMRYTTLERPSSTGPGLGQQWSRRSDAVSTERPDNDATDPAGVTPRGPSRATAEDAVAGPPEGAVRMPPRTPPRIPPSGGAEDAAEGHTEDRPRVPPKTGPRTRQVPPRPAEAGRGLPGPGRVRRDAAESCREAVGGTVAGPPA